jgi:hypothetical protein
MMGRTLMRQKTPDSSSPTNVAPEFALLLACARWPFRSQDREHLRVLTAQPLDWGRFLSMARSHEVMPLVYRNLRAAAPEGIPQAVIDDLRCKAALNMVSNSQWQKAVVSLLDRFEQAGLAAPRLLKGIPLAVEIFGEPGLRTTNDIDLLVAPAEAMAVDALLRSSGFERIIPAARLTPRRLAAYLANWKDFSYVHPRDRITVELHWRLHLNSAMPTIDLADAAATTWTTLGGRPVAILPASEVFLYLCTHGALDGWYKLKWLADVSAMGRQFSPQHLDQLCRRARQIGMLPEFSAALHLSNTMLDAGLACDGMLSENEPTVARIVKYSLGLMTANDYCPEWEAGPEMIRYELALRSSASYRWQILRRILFRPRMWERYDLPDSLFALYAIISPFEWLAFHRRESRAQRI